VAVEGLATVICPPRVSAKTTPIVAAMTASATSAIPAVRFRRLPGLFGVLMNYFASAPSRRAARARCRPDRNLRNRLTSIGSAASASGRSITLLSAW
jgi:hypothetical protein